MTQQTTTPQSAYDRLDDQDKHLINSQLAVMAVSAQGVANVPGHQNTPEQLALNSVISAMVQFRTETDTPELTREAERLLETLRESYATSPMLEVLRRAQQQRPQTAQELAGATYMVDLMIAVDGDQHDPRRDAPWTPPAKDVPQR